MLCLTIISSCGLDCSEAVIPALPSRRTSSDISKLANLFFLLPEEKLHVLRVQLLAITGLFNASFLSTPTLEADGYEAEVTAYYSMWETSPVTGAPGWQTPTADSTSKADSSAPPAGKAGKKGKGLDKGDPSPADTHPVTKAGKKGAKGQEKEDGGPVAGGASKHADSGRSTVVQLKKKTLEFYL